jgi:hypothetical protein
MDPDDCFFKIASGTCGFRVKIENQTNVAPSYETKTADYLPILRFQVLPMGDIRTFTGG